MKVIILVWQRVGRMESRMRVKQAKKRKKDFSRIELANRYNRVPKGVTADSRMRSIKGTQRDLLYR